MMSSIPIKYEKNNRFICPVNGTLTRTAILTGSKPGNNGDEVVLDISQMSRTRASPSDAV